MLFVFCIVRRCVFLFFSGCEFVVVGTIRRTMEGEYSCFVSDGERRRQSKVGVFDKHGVEHWMVGRGEKRKSGLKKRECFNMRPLCQICLLFCS